MDTDTDGEIALMERRWFASLKAVRTMQAECAALRTVVELAEASWRNARGRLSSFEALRDALGEALAECDRQRQPQAAQRSAA